MSIYEEEEEGYGTCQLCERTTKLTQHHLIPRKLHKKPFYKKTYTRDELRICVSLCEMCHSGLHRIHDEKTIGKNLYTLELLKNDPSLQKHYHWVAKQKIR